MGVYEYDSCRAEIGNRMTRVILAMTTIWVIKPCLLLPDINYKISHSFIYARRKKIQLFKNQTTKGAAWNILPVTQE